MYFSTLVLGHQSSPVGRYWSTFDPLTLVNSILVVIANKGAAMCTRQRQYIMLISFQLISMAQAHRGAEWAEAAELLFLCPPETSEGPEGGSSHRHICTRILDNFQYSGADVCDTPCDDVLAISSILVQMCL